MGINDTQNTDVSENSATFLIQFKNANITVQKSPVRSSGRTNLHELFPETFYIFIFALGSCFSTIFAII